MKRNMLILVSMFFLTIFMSHLYIKNNVDFRIVLENRTNFYLRLEEENIIDQNRKDDFKNLAYCENKINITNGVECGFYLNGFKFIIGEN